MHHRAAGTNPPRLLRSAIKATLPSPLAQAFSSRAFPPHTAAHRAPSTLTLASERPQLPPTHGAPIHRLALLLGLLAFTAAAAATGARAQPACEPSNLATQITLFCMPDMPTAPCCEPVVASVDLGGGVPCLCRVAAQPQLVLAASTPPTSSRSTPPAGAYAPVAPTSPLPAKVTRHQRLHLAPLSRSACVPARVAFGWVFARVCALVRTFGSMQCGR
ncbi:hypothetical protein HU200_032438 [Digitaria exilis]|uniref:Bifunctional inhibitor/plant lipid transfer protein/seed storage helical domain-containing protein n=1 Tax=Digitaria exilis TaxID=1010633 RepID=A0A835ELL7_9POAL|nr:hypothetical protein HU200_032438 [Digitaria exilis]